MGAFATVKFLSIVFALLAGLSVYLFTQLRKERSRATLTFNSLRESKARSLDALKGVILVFARTILRDRLESRRRDDDQRGESLS